MLHSLLINISALIGKARYFVTPNTFLEIRQALREQGVQRISKHRKLTKNSWIAIFFSFFFAMISHCFVINIVLTRSTMKTNINCVKNASQVQAVSFL